MQVKVPIIQLILGTLVSIVIAMAVEFFVFSVDYSRTEYTQFEDDEYYYMSLSKRITMEQEADNG